MEGEVKQDPSELHINLYLIHAPEDSQVWTASYSRKLTAENIYLLQKEITKDVLQFLNIKTKNKEQHIKKPTSDLDAYRLYIQGRTGIDQRTEAGIYRGLDCFQGSIELDADYALAWSGLADALSLLHYYSFPVPRNSPDPIEAALKAVNLQPGLPEAHTALGIAYSTQQKGPAALKELKHAVALSPGYAEALIWLGWVYLVLGKPEKAMAPGLQAVRLNPLNPAVRVFLAQIYLANGLYEEALAEAKRGREINPEYGLARYMEGLVLYHCSKFEEAATAFEKTLTIISGRGTPSIPEVKTALVFAQYSLGDKNSGRQVMSEIYGRIDPFPLALLQALFGKIDEAFKTFARTRDWSSFSTETIRYFYPEALAPLREDKRYVNLIAGVNEAWGLQTDGNFTTITSE